MKEPKRQRLNKTKARPLGVRPGINLDNIQELIDQLESEESELTGGSTKIPPPPKKR
jgi:hypothetical protein